MPDGTLFTFILPKTFAFLRSMFFVFLTLKKVNQNLSLLFRHLNTPLKEHKIFVLILIPLYCLTVS